MAEFGDVLVEYLPAKYPGMPGGWWTVTCIAAASFFAIGAFVGHQTPSAMTASDFNSCLLVNVKEAKLDIVARAMYQMCEERYRPRATP